MVECYECDENVNVNQLVDLDEYHSVCEECYTELINDKRSN